MSTRYSIGEKPMWTKHNEYIGDTQSSLGQLCGEETEQCEACKGSGQSNDYYYGQCPVCHGYGEVLKVDE